MLLDVCFGTRTAWKILFVLSEAPGKAVSRKEIQALTKLGNKVSKFLVVLGKFNIIIITKIGKINYYKLNMTNPFVEQIISIVSSEKQLLNNPDFVVLNILREFVYELTNINLDNLKSLILFGSYAKRTYNKNSDIDIAIILKKKNTSDELLITEIIDRLTKRFNKEIQPHYFTEKDFEEQKKEGIAKEILKDGIKLL